MCVLVCVVKQGDTQNVSLIGPQVFGGSLILRLLDPDFPLETEFNTYMSTTPVWLWRVNKEYLQQYFAANPDVSQATCASTHSSIHEALPPSVPASLPHLPSHFLSVPLAMDALTTAALSPTHFLFPPLLPSSQALVEACEGLLCDMDQLQLLGIDNGTENALYNKVLSLKKTLPERAEAQESLPRGASKQFIYTTQDDGEWSIKTL